MIQWFHIIRKLFDCRYRIGVALYLVDGQRQAIKTGVYFAPDSNNINRDLMKSTSGMCVILGVGNFISSLKVQKLNSKSSTESEIIAVSDGMNVPLWLAGFIAYQGHGQIPVRLEQDNQSCITLLTKGRSAAETTRFIEVRKFWISDYTRIGAVNIVYVPTKDMTSDYFTKPSFPRWCRKF